MAFANRRESRKARVDLSTRLLVAQLFWRIDDAARAAWLAWTGRDSTQDHCIHVQTPNRCGVTVEISDTSRPRVCHTNERVPFLRVLYAAVASVRVLRSSLSWASFDIDNNLTEKSNRHERVEPRRSEWKIHYDFIDILLVISDRSERFIPAWFPIFLDLVLRFFPSFSFSLQQSFRSAKSVTQ